MARSNNKYASHNFNDIYEKKISSPSSSSSSNPNNKQSIPNKTIISNSRIHGNMLVLSRPTPKPISLPSPPPSPSPSSSAPAPVPQQQPVIETSDSISLRPQGKTGSLPIPSTALLPSPIHGQGKEEVHVSLSPKTNRFVPPHLRPGFVGKEEKPEPPRPVSRQGQGRGHLGVLPNPYGEEIARPKSGGGMRVFESLDPMALNRPRSSGGHPRSSGL